VSLARILRRHTDSVEVEAVIIGLGEPQERLIPTRKPLRGVQPVPKMPDDPIPKKQAKPLEDAIVKDVQRIDFSILYEVTYLPAEASITSEDSTKFRNDLRLCFEICFNRNAILVIFAQVVRGRSDDEVYGTIRYCGEEIADLTVVENQFGLRAKAALNFLSRLKERKMCHHIASVSTGGLP
jgi:hypothetical protein